MILNYHEVERLFDECSDQGEVIVELYKMVFPQWDSIEKIDGWPTINRETNDKISKLFMEFDAKNHPETFKGGLWLNNGFSSLEGQALKDWQVDISTCDVILKGASCRGAEQKKI